MRVVEDEKGEREKYKRENQGDEQSRDKMTGVEEADYDRSPSPSPAETSPELESAM